MQAHQDDILGMVTKQKNGVISFANLCKEASKLSLESVLVSVLMGLKKQGAISYNGEVLFKDVHDNVLIRAER